LITVFPVSAGTVTQIDFENLVYGNYVTTQYTSQGATFTGNALVLDTAHCDPGYPPHSGTKLVDIVDGSIRVDFTNPVSRVGVWYTTGQTDAFLEAYDSQGNLLQRAEGIYNYGFSNYLEVSGSNIAYVIIHDTGDWFGIDDLSYETPSSTSIPEFPSVATPVAAILGLIVIFGRRKNTF